MCSLSRIGLQWVSLAEYVLMITSEDRRDIYHHLNCTITSIFTICTQIHSSSTQKKHWEGYKEYTRRAA